MPSAGSVTIEVKFVRPKVVHKRDRTRLPSMTLCGARIMPRAPAYHLADDDSIVTCKNCKRFLP
jgi:hypothetical protein